MDLLKDDEITSRIRMVGPWEYDSEDKILIRETMFKDFMEAMGFLNKLAEAAEKLNHHPDMTLCEYSRVIVTTGNSIPEFIGRKCLARLGCSTLFFSIFKFSTPV